MCTQCKIFLVTFIFSRAARKTKNGHIHTALSCSLDFPIIELFLVFVLLDTDGGTVPVS